MIKFFFIALVIFCIGAEVGWIKPMELKMTEKEIMNSMKRSERIV